MWLEGRVRPGGEAEDGAHGWLVSSKAGALLKAGLGPPVRRAERGEQGAQEVPQHGGAVLETQGGAGGGARPRSSLSQDGGVVASLAAKTLPAVAALPARAEAAPATAATAGEIDGEAGAAARQPGSQADRQPGRQTARQTGRQPDSQADISIF